MEYEGQTFFRPDVAQLVRRSVADSPEGKEIAESLGVDQLPKPSDIREYELLTRIRLAVVRQCRRN